MSALPEQPDRPGLRERKKAMTRAAIREQALRLFREQGYDATTVEQIADAADVSPSTFFRYFPTKEDVVLQDDMELRWSAALQAQPPELSPVAALRAAMLEVFASLPEAEMALLRESMELALTVPAVRARSLDEFGRTIQFISSALAERTGRPVDDVMVQTLAGAIMGVAMAAWYADPQGLDDFAARFERGLAFLESGFQL